MNIQYLNSMTKGMRFIILISCAFLGFASNKSGALAQSQGAKSKNSEASKTVKNPSGALSKKAPPKKLSSKTQTPGKKSQPIPKKVKSDPKPNPSAEKILAPSAKPLKVDQKNPINKNASKPEGIGSNLSPEATKKAKTEKLSKSKTKIEKNQDGAASLHEGEAEGSTIWVWLIPVGFFTAAGGLYLFQRFQHLLVHQAKESKPNEDIRPESRAEVAFGSVLASLDLDSARSEDSGSKAVEKPADKRGKAKNFQESMQNSARKELQEDEKTKVSGPKPKTLNHQIQHHHATLVSEKMTMPKSGEAIAISASLEPESNSPVDSKAATPGVKENQGSTFLTAPPSAMNWVNPFQDDQSPANEPNIKLKQASGYQNSVGKTTKKDPK